MGREGDIERCERVGRIPKKKERGLLAALPSFALRYLGNSGRSNTPWQTSCENSVQGGILQ